jgi:hypothetical protein
MPSASASEGCAFGGVRALDAKLCLEEARLGGGAAGFSARLDPFLEDLEQVALPGNGVAKELGTLLRGVEFEQGLAHRSPRFPRSIDHMRGSGIDAGAGDIDTS